MPKGIIVNVYRSGVDCTNNGVTSKNDKCILVGDGIPELFEASEEMPALYYIEDEVKILAEVHSRCAAWVDPKGNNAQRWAMFGGNFVYSSDSRFPLDHPIKVFDRFE